MSKITKLKNDIMELLSEEDKTTILNYLKEFIHSISDQKNNPVGLVRWVPVDMVQANDYNPNSVAGKEMQLLYTSIKNDGYTQPIVTIYDKNINKYIIIDGFHRYFIGKNNADILETTGGLLPIVVLEKNINDRMAATVRHNRARGTHSVSGMSNMVLEMLKNGWEDVNICNQLGMEPEELLRLKHITGFSKLFDSHDYSMSWETNGQAKRRKEYKLKNNLKNSYWDFRNK